MNVEFTSEEATLLKDMIEQRIRELGPEIHHTDRRMYRKALEETREKLERILDHLKAVAA